MDKSALRLLQCPYCYGSVRLLQVLEQTKHGIRYGITQCSCDKYPIIEGIIVLTKPINSEVLALMAQRKYAAARAKLITVRRFYNSFLRLILPPSPLSRFCERLFHKPLIIILGLKRILYPLALFNDMRGWAQYLIRIPGSSEMIVPLVLLKRVQAGAPVIVDVGCGITPYAADNSVLSVSALVGIDKNFALLYLSKIFFHNPKQVFACADLAHGLPVKPHVADVVFSLNCFTYLYNQQQVFVSLVAAANSTGLVCVGDLHERVDPSLLYWYPRKPAFYTHVTDRHTLVFDYDECLRLIEENKTVDFRRIPYKGKGHRYGIIMGNRL